MRRKQKISKFKKSTSKLHSKLVGIRRNMEAELKRGRSS